MSSVQSHQSDPRVLNRRTVERDHRGLLEHLHQGQRVLDVGCGTGSITAGIARLVAPGGEVLGIDRDADLLAIARQHHGAQEGLRFERCDVLELPATASFDIVTAARVLQWSADPLKALRRMKAATTPGGLVVVLDYNHASNAWEPAPPEEFQSFYRAFLDWRTVNGWSNHIASELPDLFRQAGLEVRQTQNCSEQVARGDADFERAVSIWADVVESLGPAMVAAGFLTGSKRQQASQAYRQWSHDGLIHQSLSLWTITGQNRA
ncbi:MAG: methyltransferase domain-containing protein [Acidobacteria bacterium]|nr:methyltransferase domain-containing protein [Acidobacteriota bacterium]